MLKKMKIWGLVLAAVGGWAVAGSMVLGMSFNENNYDAVNDALTKSLVERNNLTEELKRTKGQLEATKKKLLVFQNQSIGSSSQFVSLKERDQQKMAVGGALKYMTIKRAKLRLGPSIQSQELAILSPKTPLEVLGRAENGEWLEVVRVGYVHNELLRPAP